MALCETCGKTHTVGFIATRLSGTDGVSLETEKWADIFEKKGFNCCYFAGELDRASHCSYLVEEAHFMHPEILDIRQKCFGDITRSRLLTTRIHALTEKLKTDLYEFIEKFSIGFFVVENCLAIPLNIPLALAITEVIAETGMPTIAHHHDFFWERQEFLTNAVWDYLNMAFPPHIPTIQHVVLNSSQDNQLSLRTGISPTVIPNVMDFENPPPPVDEYAADVRQALKIDDDTLFILQPTRVVQRKGIEHAIELVRQLNRKSKLIISHASGDEGHDYEKRIRQYSRMLNVDTVFESKIINESRGTTRGGRKIYSLEDIYPHADLVTYPSTYEGFGNAFLEAIYYRKPIVVNTYSIYEMDIKPKGFSVIEINGYITDKAVRDTLRILSDPELRKDNVEKNYNIAKQYYSYAVLENKLQTLLADCIDCEFDLTAADIPQVY